MPRRLLLVPLLLAALGGRADAAEPAPPSAPYQAPMQLRAQCEEELRKDAGWNKELRDLLRAGVHEEDAKAMLTNKQHVQYAYAALWLLVVVFLGFLYRKQLGLRGEINRLERELDDAKKK